MKISTIPYQLQKSNFGFVKLKPRSKQPFESNWQNRPYSFEKIQDWHSKGNNYGVLGGVNNLIIIDSDDPTLSNFLLSSFPQTFTVKTPRSGYHFYYQCPGIQKKIVLKREGKHCGEIISSGSQVVGPGSTHPETKTEYEVERDIEISCVDPKEVLSHLVKYVPIKTTKDHHVETSDINIMDILDRHGIKLRSSGSQLIGSHPVHGSKTQSNFVVHPEKNCWHCFRCDSGGGPLSLIAVLNGIIDCSESLPGALRGDKFKQVLKIVEEQYESKLCSPEKEPPGEAPLEKHEIIKKLKEKENHREVHPAQDFVDGTMVFSVMIDKTPYLLTSNRDIFALKDADTKGFHLEHTDLSISRFSREGVLSFLENTKTASAYHVYKSIYAYIKRFICFSRDIEATFIALWIMGTYFFIVFRYYPYVWLNAEKGSGKTLLMEVLSSIAFNGELVTNPTESVIFRDISSNRITMFIDEVEQLRKRDKDTFGALMGLLNSGFNRSGSVKRTEKNRKGTFVTKSYGAYSPKVFAGINDIDDVLRDRTIRIPLLRKKESESVERYKETTKLQKLQSQIRDSLYAFALFYAPKISKLYEQDKLDGIQGMAHLHNRELDIWEPIFLIAYSIDQEAGNTSLVEAMTTLSKESIEEKYSDNSVQNKTCQILNILKSMIDELVPISDDQGTKVFDAQQVLEYFQKSDDFNYLEKLNTLTSLLKKVAIKSEQKRIDGNKKRVYVINVSKLTDLYERFKV